MKKIMAIAFVLFFLSIMLFFTDCYAQEAKRVELKDIVVTAKKYKKEKIDLTPVETIETPYGTQYNVITEEQLKEQAPLDFPSTLRDVPGVMFQSKNLAGSQTGHSLYIRGRGASHPSSDIIILFDGAPRFGAIFGQVLGDSIAVSTIGGIEVYKSPQPSVFGNAYAMVNILPRYTKKEGKEAEININGGSYETVNESLSAGFKDKRFDIYASQSYFYTGGHRPDSDATQQNYYLNTGYQINKEWNLRFLVNYVEASTDAPMPDRAPNATNGVSWPQAERYETESFFTTITLNNNYEDKKGFIKAYLDKTNFYLLQELTNGKRYDGNTGGLKSKQKIMLNGIRGKEIFTIWNNAEAIFGLDLDFTTLKNIQMTYSGIAAPGINGGKAKRVWDFPDTMLASPYGALNYIIGIPEGFHFIPSIGARFYSHNQFKDKSAFQAGLVIGYAHTDVNISYSRGVNYPTPVALMNFVLEGSPVNNAREYWRKIKPEIVDHYEAGIKHTIPEKASMGVLVFRDYGRDRFLTYMFGAVPAQFNDPIGYYEIEGLEVTGTVTPFKNFELFSAGTWMRKEAKGGNGVKSDKLPYTPGFQFQGGIKWSFLKHYRFFMDMQHIRDFYQGTFTRSNTFNTPNITKKDKLNDITLLNARLSYMFDYKSLHLGGSEFYIAVNNILNKRYEYAKGYPMPGITFFGGISLKFI
ncbi:MAG: TonB-dependent receptor plug domain-containing protein [Syntrophorhabdaceae bacterium]|nr:TonB-dependent receptor plug domain-containing protein [Syntrophorhabdaceae bacterium]